MKNQGNNRLPTLAADARHAHDAAKAAALTATERALTVGATLAEAKALCPHVTWGKWLASTGNPEHTAQRYLRLLHCGLKPATVADLGGLAEADRFIAWCSREGHERWSAEEMAEALISGRKLRDAEATDPGIVARILSEMTTRMEELTHEALMEMLTHEHA